MPKSVIDVDESGDGTLSEPRMYQLGRQRGRIRRRTFEVTFLPPGAGARRSSNSGVAAEATGSPICGSAVTDLLPLLGTVAA
jgi:hypothetical protein